MKYQQNLMNKNKEFDFNGNYQIQTKSQFKMKKIFLIQILLKL